MNPLSCTQVHALLSDLLLGAVAADAEESLDAHLAGCEACRLQLEQFVWQERVLAELSTHEHPTELATRVRRALSAADDKVPSPAVRSVPRPRSRGTWRRVLLAGLAASVLAAVFLYRTQPEDARGLVVAHLGRLHGEVHVLAGNGKLPAQSGLAIHAGEGIETQGLGSFAVVEYADDTRLRLGADTTVRDFGSQPPAAPTGKAGPQAFLARGLVRADVSGRPGQEPFRLRTPAAQVNVQRSHCTVASESDATQVDVEKGQAELVRESDGKIVQVGEGCYARASNDEDMVSKEPEWQDLFNGMDLTGWRVFNGRWRVEEGTLTGSGIGSRGARIDTRGRYGDFELTCQVWHTAYTELQIRNYGWFFKLEKASAGWRDVRIVARGRTFECLVDGRSVPSVVEGGPGPGRGDNPGGPLDGVIGLYVKTTGTLRVREVRLRQFQGSSLRLVR